MELLDKYGDDDAAEDKIAQEMGWAKFDEADEDDEDIADWTEDETDSIAAEVEENLPEPDPDTEGVDWMRTADDEIRHPLQHRCSQAASALWDKCDELNVSHDVDADLEQFAVEFRMTSTKLAGALNGLAYGRDITDGAFTVAYLKRALDHLHKALAGLEKTGEKKLLPRLVLARSRQELFAIREEILRLMEEFRKLR
jgi:hypothetical protein